MKKIRFFILLILLFLPLTGCGINIPDYENPETVLKAPKNFSGKKIGSEYIIFTWDSVPAAEYYNLYYIYEKQNKECLKEISTAIKTNYCYVSSISYYQKKFVIEPVSEGKKGYISTFSNESITKYFGELNYYQNEKRLVWTEWPDSNAHYYLADTYATSNDIYPSSSSSNSNLFFTDNYCTYQEIKSNSYYAVYVLADSQYRRMTDWYTGASLLKNAKTGSSGIISEETQSEEPPAETIPEETQNEEPPAETQPEEPPTSLSAVTDLNMTKYKIAAAPVFNLFWTAVDNAASYKVYAAVVTQTMSQEDLSSSWVSVSEVSQAQCSVTLQNTSLINNWNSNKTGNIDTVVYFKVESINADYNLNGGDSNLLYLQIPKETYDYTCTYTYHGYKQNGPELTVWRTGDHKYTLTWNDSESYYAFAIKDDSSDGLFCTTMEPSGQTFTIPDTSLQASESYDFALTTNTKVGNENDRISNFVLCEFE